MDGCSHIGIVFFEKALVTTKYLLNTILMQFLSNMLLYFIRQKIFSADGTFEGDVYQRFFNLNLTLNSSLTHAEKLYVILSLAILFACLALSFNSTSSANMMVILRRVTNLLGHPTWQTSHIFPCCS